MRLTLQNPKIFSDIVTIISELVTEVRIKVNKEGISLTAIDPANVAMIYFKIPAALFSEFELEKEEVELGVNLNSLKSVLEYLSKFIKGAKISNRASLSFSDNHPMRLDFHTGDVVLSFVLAPRVEQDD